MSRIAFLWLGGTALALAAIIVGELAGNSPLPPAAGVVPLPASINPASGEPAPGAQRRRIETILGRPLFDPSRRAPGGTAGAAGALRLSGTIVAPAGRQAIFEPAGSGAPVVVAVGQLVGGAVVRSIVPGAVLIVGAQGPRLLAPSYAGEAGAAASGPAAHLGSLAARLREAK
ncbi:MAG TPA: hypothetical protein VMF62_14655 [Acetobacteraceae bacterium]|nr:hypothetical protein [Acetobacteraceae bacterium]